jgi:putative glutamine amidotransferase
VNSFHREAIAEVSDSVLVSAQADNGVVEAIEIPGRRFAIGVQWHQELLPADHAGQRIVEAMVSACR